MEPHAAPAIRVQSSRSEGHEWDVASRPPAAHLAPHVLRYASFAERPAGVLRRREIPFAGVPVIVSFGAPFAISDPRIPADGARPLSSFVAGMFDSFVVTESTGPSEGVQIDMTPLGAYRLFGLPMHALTNRLVTLDEALGREGARLAERLHDARGSRRRFDILDEVIGARLARARAPSPSVEWAVRRLERGRPDVGIGALCEEIGCSRKHLIERFREQVGLPPKRLARILRFQRAVGRLGTVRHDELALECGYYDQAHMIRDFRRFAGTTPSGLMSLRLPDGGDGVAAIPA